MPRQTSSLNIITGLISPITRIKHFVSKIQTFTCILLTNLVIVSYVTNFTCEVYLLRTLLVTFRNQEMLVAIFFTVSISFQLIYP
jgi:hypothetical protein